MKISKWIEKLDILYFVVFGLVFLVFVAQSDICRGIAYVYIHVICTIGVVCGVWLEHSGLIPVMVLGGLLSAMADDALQVRTDAKLQEIFPSEQRATLIFMASFTFSVIMIVLSPLAGISFQVDKS